MVVLKELSFSMPCPCGSGKAYAECSDLIEIPRLIAEDRRREVKLYAGQHFFEDRHTGYRLLVRYYDDGKRSIIGAWNKKPGLSEIESSSQENYICQIAVDTFLGSLDFRDRGNREKDAKTAEFCDIIKREAMKRPSYVEAMNYLGGYLRHGSKVGTDVHRLYFQGMLEIEYSIINKFLKKNA